MLPTEQFAAEAFWQSSGVHTYNRSVSEMLSPIPVNDHSSTDLVDGLHAVYRQAEKGLQNVPLTCGTTIDEALQNIPFLPNAGNWLLRTVEDSRVLSGVLKLLGRNQVDTDAFNERVDQIATEPLYCGESARTTVTSETGQKYFVERKVVYYLGATAQSGILSGLPSFAFTAQTATYAEKLKASKNRDKRNDLPLGYEIGTTYNYSKTALWHINSAELLIPTARVKPPIKLSALIGEALAAKKVANQVAGANSSFDTIIPVNT